MADEERNKRDKSGDGSGAEIATDMLKLVGRFLLDFGRLSIRGGWHIYRRLSSSEGNQDKLETGEKEPNVFTKLYRIAGSQVRSGQDKSTDTPVQDKDTPPARKKGVAAAGADSYIDRSAVEDEEAAAMLEDLLRETEANLRQKQAEPALPDTTSEPLATPVSTSTDDDDSEVDVAIFSPLPADVAEEAANVDSMNDAPSIEEQLRQRAETLQGQEPQPEAEPEITYNTPEERERIQSKLNAHNDLLEHEKEARAAKLAAEEAKRERIRAAMEADKARIQAEQEARAARFAEAERQRKAREQEREAASLRRARLSDTSPTEVDAPDEDNTPPQQTNNSKD